MTSPNINAEIIEIGRNTVIHPTAVIRGTKGKAKSFKVGDNSYIGHNVEIICDDFTLGDYSKIHHHSNIHGYNPCVIGHNLWMGQFVILDTIGGVRIGNNCGIGAHSQLWSHIKYGDTLEGCRFFSERELLIGDDVWFVGRTTVSPIKAEDKSMALAGSVVTKDMKYNNIYAGSPAKSISDKIGFQFKETTLNEKKSMMEKYLRESGIDSTSIKIIETSNDISDLRKSYFILSTRQYTKRSTPSEIAFMNYLLPEKAKFVPFLNDTI